MVTKRSGFTLLELLVVIAIVLILILIALPNFLEVQVRAGVVRVQGELRSISTALGSYYLDFGFYPLRTLNASLPPGTPSGLNNLTTPVEYMNPASLPDPFPQPPFFTHYRYWPIRPNGVIQTNDETARNDDSNWYLLSSNGPSRDFTPFADRMRGDDPHPFLDSIYSPTNGTKSEGNIWRLGGNPDGVAEPNVAPYVVSG